jgi:hypothetical protein
VLERVQRQTAHHLRRTVAQAARDKTVRHFVHGDGEQHRQRPDGDLLRQGKIEHGGPPPAAGVSICEEMRVLRISSYASPVHARTCSRE